METPAETIIDSGSVLVVYDDGEILGLVTKFLQSNGFWVHTARNWEEMTEALGRARVDLIVFDVKLPGTNGLDLCSNLRLISSVPIVMLTDEGDIVERLVGFEVGSDDYLSKPFDPRELLARVNAVLMRSRGVGTTANETGRGFAFDGWRLDTLKRELTNPAGVVVDLSTVEYDLLLAFLKAPQRVLSWDILGTARRVADCAPDRIIDVRVHRLRRKLGGPLDLIKAAPEAGYLFTADVSRF